MARRRYGPRLGSGGVSQLVEDVRKMAYSLLIILHNVLGHVCIVAEEMGKVDIDGGGPVLTQIKTSDLAKIVWFGMHAIAVWVG